MYRVAFYNLQGES